MTLELTEIEIEVQGHPVNCRAYNNDAEYQAESADLPAVAVAECVKALRRESRRRTGKRLHFRVSRISVNRWRQAVASGGREALASRGADPRLIYRTHRGRRGDKRKGFTETDYARFLDAARQQLNGPVVLVWDNLPVWSVLKRSLANLTKHNSSQLTVLVKTRLRRMQYRPGLLDGFLAKTGLDLTPLQ